MTAAVIFDCDGVLVDSEVLYHAVETDAKAVTVSRTSAPIRILGSPPVLPIGILQRPPCDFTRQEWRLV